MAGRGKGANMKIKVKGIKGVDPNKVTILDILKKVLKSSKFPISFEPEIEGFYLEPNKSNVSTAGKFKFYITGQFTVKKGKK
jgi:hypothetical protein